MTDLDTVLYIAETHTTGGREGTSQSDDYRLDVKLSPPGGSGTGTNPELMLAAGWSAGFTGSMRRIARDMKL